MAQEERTQEQQSFIDRLLMELPKVFGTAGANHDEMLSAIAGYLAYETDEYSDAELAATLHFLTEEVFEIRKTARAIRAKGMH